MKNWAGGHKKQVRNKPTTNHLNQMMGKGWKLETMYHTFVKCQKIRRKREKNVYLQKKTSMT